MVGGQDALAVDAHGAGFDELLGQRAGFGDAGVPEPFVEALAGGEISGHGRFRSQAQCSMSPRCPSPLEGEGGSAEGRDG